MTSAARLACSAALCTVVLGACGSDERAAGPSVGRGGSNAGAQAGATDGGSPDTSTAGGGSSNEGGANELPGGGVPSFPTPLCDPEWSYGEETAVDLPGSGALSVLALTPDELTVAFLRGEGAEQELGVSDRERAKDDFESAQWLAPRADFDFTRGVALSADGRRLVLVRGDGKGFAELRRPARGEDFETDEETAEFVQLALDAEFSGALVEFPLLSADNARLYYVRSIAESRVVVSQLGDDDVYMLPAVIDEFTLGGTSEGAKLLSGLAEDERSIYYFDEATGQSAALFRSRPDGPFYDPVDYGERRALTPNADCSALYSTSVAAGETRFVRQIAEP